jgi:hypothetical protein
MHGCSYTIITHMTVILQFKVISVKCNINRICKPFKVISYSQKYKYKDDDDSDDDDDDDNNKHSCNYK